MLSKISQDFAKMNYRPISVLSNISRLIEALIYNRFYKFLNQPNVYAMINFAFEIIILLKIKTDKIQNALDDGKYACDIFLDFQKAFDSMNHKILFFKLEY